MEHVSTAKAVQPGRLNIRARAWADVAFSATPNTVGPLPETMAPRQPFFVNSSLISEIRGSKWMAAGSNPLKRAPAISLGVPFFAAS